MKNRFKKFNKNVFFGSILPYLAIVLLVFTVHTVSSTVVLNALENNAKNVVKNSIEANIVVIEESMNSIRDTAMAVLQNVYQKLDGEKDREVYTRLTDAKAVLRTYNVKNSVIKNICVQHDRNDLLVSFNAVYSARLNFYISGIVSENLSSQELLENSEKASGFNADGIGVLTEGAEVIPYFLPAPLMAARTGSVIVYIDKQALLLPMGNLLSENGGALRITNQEGRVLLKEGANASELFEDDFVNGLPEKTSFNKKPYYVFSYTDEVSKWTYTMLVPEEYVMRDTKYYQMVSLGLNFLALLIGFALCLFFVLRKSDSYIELMEVLGVDMEKFRLKHFILKNEYKYLYEHISKIKDENEELLERDNQNVMRMLLNGEFDDEEVIANELRKHGMEFVNEKYGVIVLSHKDKRVSDSYSVNFRIFVLREIQKIIPDSRVYFGEKNTTVIIFSTDSNDFRSVVDMYISKLEIDVLFKYRISVIFGVGNSADTLCGISGIYNQAQAVVKYNTLLENKNLRFYDSIPESCGDYYYPIEIQNELYDSVLESNFENARNALRKIQEENFEKRVLSLEEMEELLAEMRTDFRKIGKLRSEQLEFVRTDESVSHFFEYAISFFYLLCSDGEGESQSRTKRICREIQKYIDSHFDDVNLSLPSVAEEFRMHPNYLSSIFKKHTGQSLVSYLENLRTEKAAELLAEGKHTVNEVAFLSGFSNTGTFRRIFKKIKGVTPTNYHKS